MLAGPWSSQHEGGVAMPELNVVAGVGDDGVPASPLVAVAQAVAAAPPGLDGLDGLEAML
jgi:hypothetical protein